VPEWRWGWFEAMPCAMLVGCRRSASGAKYDLWTSYSTRVEQSLLLSSQHRLRKTKFPGI
jgi:hypothetical protein